MIKRTLQEWSDFSGMIGTISTSGVILLHEKIPEKKQGEIAKYIYIANGSFIALPRDSVSDYKELNKIVYPRKI